MKVRDLISRDDQTTALKLKARKKKKNNPTPSESNPHTNDIDVHNGMAGIDRVDGVIQS